jgi:hypothetical protein
MGSRAVNPKVKLPYACCPDNDENLRTKRTIPGKIDYAVIERIIQKKVLECTSAIQQNS